MTSTHRARSRCPWPVSLPQPKPMRLLVKSALPVRLVSPVKTAVPAVAALLEDENLVMLTQMTTSATAYVFWFRLEPFEVLGVDLLAISDLSNGVDGGHGSVAYLSKGAHLGAVTIAPVGPGADPKEFQRVQLDGFVGHLERFRREPGTEFAWVGGEFGTDIVRIDLANRRQDRTLSRTRMPPPGPAPR